MMLSSIMSWNFSTGLAVYSTVVVADRIASPDFC